MGSHALLTQWTPFKPSLPIRVKVLTMVHGGVVSKLQREKLILGDEKGNLIEATLLRDSEEAKLINLEEDHCYEIKNFITSVNSGRVRLTKHPYHITLNSTSIVVKVDKFTSPNYYSFLDFQDVERGLAHPKFSIDLYGVIVGVGFLVEFMEDAIHQNNGFIDYKIRFFLLNIENNEVIKCVAYGPLAFLFQDLWNARNADVVFCVLQFWQVNWGLDRLKNVSTIEGFSKIIFEPNNVPEIEHLRKRIPNEE